MKTYCFCHKGGSKQYKKPYRFFQTQKDCADLEIAGQQEVKFICLWNAVSFVEKQRYCQFRCSQQNIITVIF